MREGSGQQGNSVEQAGRACTHLRSAHVPPNAHPHRHSRQELLVEGQGVAGQEVVVQAGALVQQVLEHV